MVRVSDTGSRGPGFNTWEGQTLFRIFDECHDYSSHDLSDLKKETVKSIMVDRKTTNIFFYKFINKSHKCDNSIPCHILE